MSARHFMRFSFTRSLLAAVALLVAVRLSAEQAEKPYNLSEKTSEELTKVQPLLDGKKTAEALAVVDAQFKKVAPDSFDAAVLLQIKAQILLQNNQQHEGIEPLERCLVLSDAHSPPFFEDRVTLEFVYFLAQLYYQEVGATKDPRVAAIAYDKSESYMERWTKMATKLTAEPILFYASLLYNRATEDGAKVDEVRLKKALGLVEKGLALDTRPKDNLYLLKLACLLQTNKYAEAGEILELLLARQPDHKNYWEQLVAIYLSLDQQTRAVVTIERAKAHGFMNTPKDNFNLVGIYFNIGQFEKAAELLESGIKDGSLANDQKNWELLSYSYQQLHRDFKSIDALSRAVKAIPTSGQLEYMLAQGYFSLNKTADAITHAQEAVRRGNLNKPSQAYLFLAYLSFESKQFEIALDAVDKAIALPDGAEEGKRMKSAIQDAIAERESKLKKM